MTLDAGRTRIPILMYHRVETDGNIDRLSQLLAIEESRFLSQMRYLVEKGFETLTLPNFLSLRKEQEPLPAKSIVLTFDDGYESAYTRVLPILQQCGLTATFFIISGLVGTRDYLKWDQLVAMKEAGMNIESHTHTHPVLTELSRDEIREELQTSKDILEEKLASEISTLCVPGGFTNASVSETAREIGYRAICTSLPGLNRVDKDHFELGRISIKGFDPMSKFEAFASCRYDRIYLYRLRQLTLAGIRKTMGLKNYERAKALVLKW